MQLTPLYNPVFYVENQFIIIITKHIAKFPLSSDANYYRVNNIPDKG